MALNVKQVVAVGLGLGLATALGYHFLSSPTSTYTPANNIQVRPLGSFALAKTPHPERIPLDESNRFQARQLPGRAAYPTAPSVSYGASADGRPTTPNFGSNQLQSDAEPFALELNSPSVVSSQPSSIEVPESRDNGEFEYPPNENFDFAAELAASPQRQNSNQQIPPSSVTQPNHGLAHPNSTSAQMPSIQLANAPAPTKTPKGWRGNPFADSPQPGLNVAANQTSDEHFLSAEKSPATVDSNYTPDHTPDTNGQVLSLNDPNRIQPSQEPASVVAGPIRRSSNSPSNNNLLSLAPQHVPLNDAVAQQAAQRIEYGKALSRRGAGFSARQEFLAALQLIANANDRSTRSNLHGQALKQALQTIEEAQDFSVATPEQQIHLDLASVVQTHRSSLLTPAEAQQLSPSQAMNIYFSAAQKQLDFAGGRNVVSAEAYFCLGKLNTLLSRKEKVPGRYDTAQSAVFHQAALLSDNKHHRSANELGVLLAKNGRLAQAKILFERSLKSKPTVRTWQNLAETHRRLGETNLANRATNEFKLLAAAQVSNANSEIQWMPIDQFNAEAPTDINQQRIATRPATPTPKEKPSFTDRLKNLF